MEFNEIYFCEDVLCDCTDVGTDVTLDDGSGPHRVVLDPFARALAKKQPAQTLRQAKIVAASLDDSDWTALYEVFLHEKSQSMEAFDPSSRVVRGLFDDGVIGRGQMWPMLQTFPFADQYFFDYEDKSYWLDDFHCLRPNCDCSVCTIEVIPSSKGSATQKPTRWHLTLDLANGEFTEIKTGEPIQDEVVEMTAAARQEHPELIERLVERRDLLRALHASCGRKVGRNDPCICGSGKKYKRCCGR
ncbi:MAG: hypothetical protein ACI9WU_002304 [Myxococcota bacterium]|jgi:hypothetical protein